MFGRRTSQDTSRPGVETARGFAPARSDPNAPGEGIAGSLAVETATLDATDDSSAFHSLWEPAAAAARKSVETLLLERGHINEAQLSQARQVASQTPGKTLAQILLTMNAASESQILSALAETLSLPFETPDKAAVDPRAFEMLSTDYIRKHVTLPLRFEGPEADGRDERALVVGMSDPNNVFLVDEVKRKVKRDVRGRRHGRRCQPGGGAAHHRVERRQG